LSYNRDAKTRGSNDDRSRGYIPIQKIIAIPTNKLRWKIVKKVGTWGMGKGELGGKSQL